MSDINKGFGIACGVILALMFAGGGLCLCCGLLYALADPTTQRVFENITR